MFLRRFTHQSSMPGLIFLALFVANAAWLKNGVVGLFLLIVFLWLFGGQIGHAVAPDDAPALRRWLGVWQLLSGLMIVGTVIYEVWAFPWQAAIILALLVPPIAWLLVRKYGRADFNAHDLEEEVAHPLPPAALAAASVGLLAFAATFVLLAHAATTQAIASPWTVVPPTAFFAFGLGALALAALWFHGRERALALGAASAGLLVFLAVSVLVFPLGAGFDPFIHRAAEAQIAAIGVITPKTFYYIGQYALVAFFQHAFFIPTALADRWLLPILTALLLPWAWLSAAEHLLPNRRHAPFTLIGLFLLPLGLFAVTTPQGLADLWILLLVLAAVPFLKRFERPRVYALAIPALAAIAIHPLAGLPALLFVGYLACDPAEIPPRLATVAIWLRRLIVVGGALLLPLSFFVVSRGMTGSGLDLSNLGEKIIALFPVWPTLGLPFHPALDFAVTLGWASAFIFVLLAALGFRRAEPRVRNAALAMSGLLLVNYILLATVVDFSFLIDYERLNYADRLLPFILFFLTPLAILGLGTIREKLTKTLPALRLFFIVLCAGVIVGAWYSAYPRDDAYLKGHGYNVSQADVDAVNAIEKDAAGQPYVVLADQSLSAAAISTLGFRYFGNQFFYPIPTGGDLYALFLQMNAAPERADAEAAMDIVQSDCTAAPNCTTPTVNRAYFTVENYWWNAPNISAIASLTASAHFDVDNGQVQVFRFDR